MAAGHPQGLRLIVIITESSMAADVLIQASRVAEKFSAARAVEGIRCPYFSWAEIAASSDAPIDMTLYKSSVGRSRLKQKRWRIVEHSVPSWTLSHHVHSDFISLIFDTSPTGEGARDAEFPQISHDILITRVAVPGNERKSKIDFLFLHVEEVKTTLKPPPPVKSSVQIKNLPIEDILKAEAKPRFEMLNCEELDALFSAQSLEKDFRRIERGSDEADRDFKGGMTVYKGKITRPDMGTVPCLLKEAKASTDYSRSYRALLNERGKRIVLGQDTRITGRLLGECVTAEAVRIAVEVIEGASPLCDDEAGSNYIGTSCYQNVKIKEMIEATDDETRSAFAFIRELLCVLAEVEMKQFFIKDIHGKHISVTSDFKVYINNVDNLSHRGSRNMLSGSICKYDENCPGPIGDLWTNTSANRVVYEKCNDLEPLCSETSCVGFNSTLHVCGVARWILQPLYSYFHRIQDRSRLTHIMISSMNSWPFLRRPVTDSCSKATLYLQLYDKDMKAQAQQQPAQRGKSFHLKPNH